MSKQKILLIVNPIAGRRKARKILYKIVDALCRENYKTTIFTTSKQGAATNIVRENGAEFQKIICCGGDGTLNEVFTGLAMENLKIPVGYIPTGTTNDLGHALGLSTSMGKAMNIAINGQIRKHDIGAFNESQYFSYIASFGAFTKVAYSTPQWLKNVLGRIAYVFKGMLSLTDIHSHRVTVTADGKTIQGDFIFGSVSNSTVIGGILKLPKAEVSFDDGQFEVLLIKNPKSPKELQAIIQSLLRHHYDSQYVYFTKASKVSFAFEDTASWTIDGEFAGILSDVHIENRQGLVEINSPIA